MESTITTLGSIISSVKEQADGQILSLSKGLTHIMLAKLSLLINVFGLCKWLVARSPSSWQLIQHRGLIYSLPLAKRLCKMRCEHTNPYVLWESWLSLGCLEKGFFFLSYKPACSSRRSACVCLCVAGSTICESFHAVIRKISSEGPRLLTEAAPTQAQSAILNGRVV